MATLHLRNGVWYLDYRIGGKRYQISTKTSDRKLAEIKLSDLKVRLFKGEMGTTAPTRVELPLFFGQFTEYCQQRYAPSNLHSDLARLRAWREFFACNGTKYLDQITPNLVNEFFTKVLAGKKPKTIKNYLTLLKTALNYAVEWGMLQRNPINSVKPPKITKTFHFLEQEEVQKLIEKAEEPLRTGIILLVSTGLRPVIQELLGHSTITMTMVYAHLPPHTHRSAVGVLDF